MRTPSPAAIGPKPIPPAPQGFKAEEFFANTYWYQQWEIFQGIITPGVGNNVHALFDNLLHVPKDLTGKRVLDIGAWNGCTSFECERRGAREVIALGPEDPSHTGFNKIKALLGSTRTHYRNGTVYDLDPKELGHFDVVLFLGVLYHLRYPLLGLDNIRRVCTGTVFVETFVTDNAWIVNEPGGIKKQPQASISPKLETNPHWQFYSSDELDGDTSNWFGPNTTAVIQGLQSAGFTAELLSTWGFRAGLRGEAKQGLPEFLRVSPFDRLYYKIVTAPVLGENDFTCDKDASWRVPILLSKEYFAKAGGIARQWVECLYRDLLGREASGVEVDVHFASVRQWLPGSRRRIVSSILTSPEYLKKQIAEYFSRFLRRAPSENDTSGYLHRMMRGNSEEDIILAFVCSHEYFCHSGLSNKRWLERVCLDLLERNPGLNEEQRLDRLERCIDTRSAIAADMMAGREYRALWSGRMLPHRNPSRQQAA